MAMLKKTCSPERKRPIPRNFDENILNFEHKNVVLAQIKSHPYFLECTSLREEVALLANYSNQYAHRENDMSYKFLQKDIASILEMSIDQVKYHFSKAKKNIRR